MSNSSPKKARNVILILTDQQHYRTLGVTGATVARTPNIDRLASQGVCFDNHIVTNPVCSPSRGSLMTGLLPSQNGLWSNGCALPTHHRTIASTMCDHGWQTAHFGKLHLVPIISRTEPHPAYGFETCEVAEGDQQLLDDAYFRWLRKSDPDLFVRYVDEMFTKGHDKAYTSVMPQESHLSTWVTARATQWLADRRDRQKPFFLSVGYFDPHHAFNPCEPFASQFADVDVQMPHFQEGAIDSKPPQYAERFENMKNTTRDPPKMQNLIRAYHAMMAHIDQCVGDLMTTLSEQGLLETTDIIFSSDHGELLGNHGLLWKGPMLLDDLLRVPMIISRHSGQTHARSSPRHISDVTSMLDLLATVQSLAGVPMQEIHCASGQPMVDAQMNPLPQGSRGYALCEWDSPNPSPSASLRCIRTQDWKLVHYNRSADGELYDLKHDPMEFANRFTDPQFAQPRETLTRQLSNYYLSTRIQTPHHGAW